MVAGVAACMELIRYVVPHLLAGCLGGAVASVGLVATNLGSLRDLMLHTNGGWLAFADLRHGHDIRFSRYRWRHHEHREPGGLTLSPGAPWRRRSLPFICLAVHVRTAVAADPGAACYWLPRPAGPMPLRPPSGRRQPTPRAAVPTAGTAPPAPAPLSRASAGLSDPRPGKPAAASASRPDPDRTGSPAGTW